jgi:circadian clock protein KaiA
LVSRILVSPLHIQVLARSTGVVKALEQRLRGSKYVLHTNTQATDFLAWVRPSPDRLDCLIIDSAIVEEGVLEQLARQGLFVPTVIIASSDLDPRGTPVTDAGLSQVVKVYHGAAIAIPETNFNQIEAAIQRAIQAFISLPAESCALPADDLSDSLPIPDLISAQKERLTDKLKARLGYLGVYYKRNPDNFLRNMREADRDQYLSQLRAGYRKIVLGYFSHDAKLNQNIDDFVNQAFFADIAVSHIVEIHMELMDEFSKQLKLEGRSEEILLDYRLTLIDVIAHLCEMYRRSIPREP